MECSRRGAVALELHSRIVVTSPPLANACTCSRSGPRSLGGDGTASFRHAAPSAPLDEDIAGLERGRRLVGGGRQSVGALRMASLCGGVYARAGHRGIRVQANQTRHHCQNTLGSCWLWAFRGRTKSRASDQAYKTRHHCQSKTTAPKD